MNTKRKILWLLEKNREEYLSGAKLASQLCISRNAVWKAINELKKDGYEIEAITNKGYRLHDNSDILSVEGLLPFLPDSYEKDLIYVFDEVESTNQTAKEMAITGAKHGTVIIADHQTGGRGRFSRSFFSPPGGGLYISFVLRPENLFFENITPVTAFAAVTVCDSIEAVTGKEPKIKWVNDVVLNRKKICGILTESISDLESGHPQWIVLGIGINVSTPDIDFPKEIQHIAGSIYPDGRKEITRNKIAAEIIKRLTVSHKTIDETMLFRLYREKLMMLGSPVTVIINGQESYKGIASDIDDLGHLLVKKDDGKLETLSFGEISIKL